MGMGRAKGKKSSVETHDLTTLYQTLNLVQSGFLQQGALSSLSYREQDFVLSGNILQLSVSKRKKA